MELDCRFQSCPTFRTFSIIERSVILSPVPQTLGSIVFICTLIVICFFIVDLLNAFQIIITIFIGSFVKPQKLFLTFIVGRKLLKSLFDSDILKVAR